MHLHVDKHDHGTHNVSMDFVIDPRDRERLLHHIAPAVPLLHEAAEWATQQTRGFFDGQSLEAAKASDPYLFAHLVRFYVKSFLETHGQDVRLDGQWLPNSGVAFAIDWVDIRFLKSDLGRLPAPGRSRIKRAFYNQTIETSVWDQNVRSYERANLVITWDVDAVGNLSALVAYSPCEGGLARDSARAFWHAELEHPALTFQPSGEELGDESGEDLDIFAEEDEEQEETDTDSGAEAG